MLGGAALALWGITGRGVVNQLVLPAVGGMLVYRGLSGHCSVYGALGMNTAEQSPQAAVEAGHGMKVEKSIVIDRPADELYRFWRRFDQLPQFMHHLEEVRILDDRRSHWVAKGPMGSRPEWDAEVINERPNELIAWRSLEGSGVDTAGSVHFTPAWRGTEVRVTLKYDPPGGKFGVALAQLFGETPDRQIEEDLWRLKEMMERGRVTTSEQTPAYATAGHGV